MLGTGQPVPDPDRFGPATVIIVDSSAYLVDCGVGVVRRWAAAIRLGIGPFRNGDLRRVFITHLHTDHTLGYPELIFTARQQRDLLQVFGPAGTQAMTDNVLAAYTEDIRVRAESPEHVLAPRIQVREISPGVVYHDSLVTITAFAVQHGTFRGGAFGFRFQTPDKDIVISGDAGPPSAIPAQCHRCDILIHEGGFSRNSGSEYTRAFHTSGEDLIEIARASQPKLLVLYHQSPRGGDAALQLVKSGYSGRVVLAKDLDVFP
jgi:ribonuclease BN (tRNA processing enzyme)